MLFNYHLKETRKMLNISLIFFAISLLLFLSIVIPNMVNRLPILGDWSSVLELNGNVLIGINDTFVPGARASIEIGGYKSVADQEGKFHLKFVSKSSTNISVIVRWSNRMTIKEISFEPSRFEKTEDFILNEE